MPMTINGFGTSVCGGRGNIGWGSYDAMEWLVALYLPVVPIKPIHTFDWTGQQYRMIPLRWSFDLVLRTFFTRWVWVPGLIGVILFFVGLSNLGSNDAIGFLVAGGLLMALGLGAGILLSVTDRRNKEIRLVLGPLTVAGNCDPYHLPGDLLDNMAADTQVKYGTPSYASAARKMLQRGSFAQAMWCARMAAALEDGPSGEALTDEILGAPEVKEAIAHVRRKSSEWAEWMTAEEDRRVDSQDEEVIEDLRIIEDLPDQPRRSGDERIRGE